MGTHSSYDAGTPLPPSAETPRRRWYTSPAALFLLLAFVGTYLTYDAKARRGASAIVRWHNQLAELATEDIYLKHAFPNPPMMGLLLSTLVPLGPTTTAMVWYWLKAGMTLVAFGLAFRMVGTRYAPVPLGAQFAVVAVMLRPVIGDLTHGNVNLFILFLCMAGLRLFQRGRDIPAGVLLGLATACKVTPLLFLPYFVWKRAWWTVVGFLGGLAAFMVLVPALFLGWERNGQLLDSWTKQMVQPFVESGEVFYTEHKNQSLPGVVMRLTTRSPSYTEYQGLERVPTAYHNLLSLTQGEAKWIVRGCLAAFALLVVVACRTPTAERLGWRLPAEFAIIFLGMLLFSERTWKHHAVTLLLPWTVLWYELTAGGSGPRLRSWLVILVGSAVLLVVGSSDLLPDPWADLPEIYGVHLVIHLLLLFALVLVLVADRWTALPEPEAPPLPTPETAPAPAPGEAT